jgi:hypothetical protein
VKRSINPVVKYSNVRKLSQRPLFRERDVLKSASPPQSYIVEDRAVWPQLPVWEPEVREKNLTISKFFKHVAKSIERARKQTFAQEKLSQQSLSSSVRLESTANILGSFGLKDLSSYESTIYQEDHKHHFLDQNVPFRAGRSTEFMYFSDGLSVMQQLAVRDLMPVSYILLLFAFYIFITS